MIGSFSICTAFNTIENNLRAVIESKSIIFPVLYELGVLVSLSLLLSQPVNTPPH